MSEKMRAEFEEWCDDNGFASDRYELCDLGEKYKHLCGEYVIPDSMVMWMAWQASRAALVVELTVQWSCFGYEDQVMFSIQVMNSLDDLGVKYK